MSFQSLPTELYEAIFGHIPPPDLQTTVLAVTRAIPLSSVPLHHLFRNIRISHPEQVLLLYRRLRQNGSNRTESPQSERNRPASWVRVLSVESWLVDAEVLINLLQMFPHLQSLNIWVGPTNFTPGHLEALFSKPLTVKYLAIRFRPYMQKANYYQFLRGAYFDASLLALARWPSLPVLSIVQDTCDPGIAQKQAFAQPIVFFQLDPCLSLLLHSPSMAPFLKSLRLRIPARPIARPLCGMTPSATSLYTSDLTPSPDLEFLDISTCSILDNELDMILTHFPSLKHLILDGCSLFRDEGDWSDLGKRCALAGVKRAKQREKALKTWIEESQASANFGVEENQERRTKRGRKGLAMATISLRELQPAFPSSSRSPLSVTPISLQRAAKIRVLPSAPTLETLSITVSPWIKSDKYSLLRAEFEAGWAEGIALLAVTKARLRGSAKNGYRVMRFSTFTFEYETPQDEWLEEGLEGLENVDPEDTSAFGQDNVQLTPPVLCFAGPGKGPSHEEHCGHSVGWEVMKDEL